MRARDMAAALADLAREHGLDDASRDQFEQALRARYGGEVLRIDRRAPVTLERIDAGLRRGQPVAEIAKDMGVGRTTLYRHLRAKRKCREEP